MEIVPNIRYSTLFLRLIYLYMDKRSIFESRIVTKVKFVMNAFCIIQEKKFRQFKNLPGYKVWQRPL